MAVLKEQLLEQIGTLDEIAHAAGSASPTSSLTASSGHHQAGVPDSNEAAAIIDVVGD